MSTPSIPLSHTQNSALRAALGGLEAVLPPIRFTPREGGEVDFYGASDRIAAQLQMDRPLFTGPKASWTHGWSGQLGPLTLPRLLVEDCYRHGVNLVDMETTAEFLRGNGYNSLAVGAPLIYADEAASPVERAGVSASLHDLQRDERDGRRASIRRAGGGVEISF